MLSKEKQDVYLYIYDKLTKKKPNSHGVGFCYYIAEYYRDILNDHKYYSRYDSDMIQSSDNLLNDFPELLEYKPLNSYSYWFSPDDIFPRLQIIKWLLEKHNIPYNE